MRKSLCEKGVELKKIRKYAFLNCRNIVMKDIRQKAYLIF